VADTRTPIDKAYYRYTVLSGILERTRQRALANPMDQRNVDLGLTEAGRKKVEVEQDISEVFEDLTNLVNHLGILDMAAAFENYFRARLSTAIGEARRVVGKHYGIEILRRDRERLVRDPDDLQGLANITSLIDGHLSAEVAATLGQIREDRNRFTHGTNIRVPPNTTTKQTRETLNEIMKSV
jgi:hypothetical protein